MKRKVLDGSFYIERGEVENPHRVPLVNTEGWNQRQATLVQEGQRQVFYFGYVVDDPHGENALKLWAEQADDLRAGRVPRTRDVNDLAVAELCDRFLVAKDQQREAGEITPLTWANYKTTCDRIVATFGKGRAVSDLKPDNFEQLRSALAKGRGIVALGNEIIRARVAFKYAYDVGLIERPMRFGPLFKRPGRKVLRRLRATQRLEHGAKMFEAAEIAELLKKSMPTMQAMILLAINCGLGN